MTDSVERLTAALSGRYAIQRELGKGGMATVYLAHDVKHNRKVAVKVLRPELAAAIGPERFLKEIEVTANLQHPNVVPLYDSGQAVPGHRVPEGGAAHEQGPDVSCPYLYYVMAYVEGESLRDRIDREGQLPMDDAIRITREVADGLDYAHSVGVIHRDIKPENIMLSRGHALIADFGIAAVVDRVDEGRLTETGITIGTPHYMSPEQAAGSRDLDGRSDVYSLGCVLYEMVVGEPPHTGPSVQAVIARRMTEIPRSIATVRPGITVEIEACAMKALASSPADRYHTAAAFVSALDTAVTESAGRPTTSAPIKNPQRRTAWRLGAVAVVIAGALLVFRPFSWNTEASEGPRIAVLPFTNLGDATDEFFTDGITELITSELASHGGLRVVSRSSAARFRNTDERLGEIGARLDVDYLLVGTVRTGLDSAGRRLVRVTPALVRAGDDIEIWSEPYSATMAAEIFATQEDIARAVTQAMNVALTPASVARSTTPTTSDDQALEVYLLGRYVLRRRDATSLLSAADHFRAAIEHDSSFAPAWSGLADAIMLHRFHYARTDSLAYERALVAAGRAIELDSASADAWASYAFGLAYGRWDWEGAEAAYRRAIALDPDHTYARIWFGELYMARGELDQATEQLEAAVRSDPMSAVAYNVLSEIVALQSFSLGPSDEWVRLKQRAIELEPGWFGPYFALAIYRSQAMPDSATRDFRRVLELAGFGAEDARRYARACVAAPGSRDASAGGECHEGVNRFAPGDAMGPALIYAAIGESDSLFAVLDLGIRQRNENIVLGLATIERMHGPDPRFADIRGRMGLN